VRGLLAVVPEAAERRALVGVAVCVFGVVGYLVFNSGLREPLRSVQDGYDERVSLGLPGAESIHLTEEEADLYRGITAAIDRNCAALVMLPGMDSFYLWSEQEPPTGYTATGWPTLFDDSHQRQVIAEIDPIQDLCQLRNEPIAAGWSNGTIPSGPLVSYLDRGFEPIGTFADYELLIRRGGSAAAS
jgi:hypothetical protein